MSDPNPVNPYDQQPFQQPFQQPYQQSYDQLPYGYGQVTGPGKRPGTVTGAAIVTFIGSGLALAGALIFILVGAVGTESMFEDFRTGAGSEFDDLADSDIALIFYVMGAIFAVWAIAAIVLAALAMRRSKVARILLVISAVMTVLVSLLMILSIFSALWLFAAIAVIVLLFTGGANQWYAAPKAP